MKRNVELIRHLLLRLEAVEGGSLVEPNDSALALQDDSDPYVITEHFRLLVDQGLLLDDSNVTADGSLFFRGLSSKGHDLLDAIRDQSVWTKVKQLTGKHLGEISLDVLKMGQKFFISFNSADRTKAHWIAWTLKEAGHEVAVHDWEIPAGGNIPLWMSTKLAWAGRLIAVVSPDYLPSRYSPMEWASQIWNDPDGTKGSVIPVIVRPTSKMPPLLEGLSRIDLTNCSEDEARRRLIEGVDMPAPPKLKPAFEKIEGEPPDSQDAGPAEKPIFVRVTELERPFLGVEVLQSGLSFTVTGTVTSSISEFKYQFINYGRTPARLTELVETWPIVNRINESEDGTKYRYTSVLPDPIDPTRQRGRTFPYGVVVSSDRPYQLSANPLAVIDVQSLAVRPWFHGEGNDLYFCGYVRYMDMFDKRYILGFCTMYDFRSGRFVLMGDDRYNYDREET